MIAPVGDLGLELKTLEAYLVTNQPEKLFHHNNNYLCQGISVRPRQECEGNPLTTTQHHGFDKN